MKRKGGNSCEIDDRLARAEETSLKTKSISPVLREELRLSILNRRHASGMEELEVEFKEPVKHELTPQEIEKKMRRREQNRRAARRCREKKKNRQEGTFLSLAQMIEENKNLEEEINRLRSQKNAIQSFLTSHESCLSVKQEHTDTPLPICVSTANVVSSGLKQELTESSLCNCVSSANVVPGEFRQEHTEMSLPNRISTANVVPSDFPDTTCGILPSLQPNNCQVHDQEVSRDQADANTTQGLEEPLPQSLVEFCLEHYSVEDDLLYDYGSDMRRQTVSVSSVSSEADVFGIESDSDTINLANDTNGLSELSEDEDVFQSNVPWVLSGCQTASALNPSQNYPPMASFETASSRDSVGACVETSYMHFLNFAEQ